MSIEHAPGREPSGVRKLVRKRKMLELFPWSYPTIWNMMRRGEFPLPVRLRDDPNAPVAWWEDELAAKQKSLQRVEYKPAAAASEADAA